MTDLVVVEQDGTWRHHHADFQWVVEHSARIVAAAGSVDDIEVLRLRTTGQNEQQHSIFGQHAGMCSAR
jgi:hypothetical protein